MHFFMGAMGSAGDVFPFIALGQELRRRGHAVDVQASPWFTERIRGAGLGFVAAGSVGDYERLVARPELWDPRRGFELLIDELLGSLSDARSAALPHVAADTVLVGSTLAWHLRLLEEERGLRAATVHLAPSCIVSADAPSVLPVVGDTGWLPAPLLRPLQRVAETLLLDPRIRRGLDPIRADLGLPPARRVIGRWMHSPQCVVAAWPDWFAPAQRDWPAASQTSGFPRIEDDGTRALDPALERFLAAGPPPVGITPGSAMAHAARFFADAVAACEALGRRAVLITPYVDPLPAGLDPGRVHHVAQAPFGRLVPRLAAFVHHGGIGTCAQAFAAGVPQLVCPFAHDQFDNAARVERLGAGRRVGRDAGAASWRTRLGAVLDDPSIRDRCDRLRSRTVEGPSGATRIVDRLEWLGRG